jgi:PAS domain S-box-containing protein
MQNDIFYEWIQKGFRNFRLRLSITGAMIVIYAIFFPSIYRALGPSSGAFITLVVLISSILLGVKGGLIVWALTVPIYILEVSQIGQDGLKGAMENWPGIVGTLILTLITGMFKRIFSVMWLHHQSSVTINDERLQKINGCFLTFEADPRTNIRRLTRLAGELLGADIALYNRIDEGNDSAVGFIQSKEIEVPSNDPACRLWHTIVDQHSDEVVIIRELQKSPYRDTLPYVLEHRLHTYAGKSVRIEQEYTGTLCMLYGSDVELGTAEKELLGILASAIGVEEKRKHVGEALRESEERYRTLYGEMVNDLAARRAADYALRESDDRLRRAEEVAMTGNWKLSLAEKHMHVSDGAKKIYGFEDNEADLADVHSAALPEYRPLLDRAMRGLIDQRSPYEVEFKIRNRANGKIMSIHSKAEYDSSSQTIFGVIQDITERKRLEQQLIQAQKMEGVGTLAGGIAHDFNNLLAMILGSAELLRQRSAGTPEFIKYVDRIIEASERGSSISRQLLIFSRPDQVEQKPISLPHIIADIRELLKHFLPKTIAVETVIETDHGTIMGDAGQIHQALLNLALNARDAMLDTGTLTIKAYTAAPDVIARKFGLDRAIPFVGLSVTDTGGGMDESVIAKIFDPFFSTKEKGKGTGLGLSIVHGIVKNHDGYIDVESAPGQGTTFFLYFPAHLHKAAGEKAAQTSAPQPQTGTILVVDDEDPLREMLFEYLDGMGYHVHTASNGTDALKLFEQHRTDIDIVITDLGMPDMRGEELYRQLKKLDADVKVIVSSGYLDRITKEHLLQMGIRGVLNKPYRLNAIRDEILNIMAHR